jgi:putative ABC transport system ATP-binding protein
VVPFPALPAMGPIPSSRAESAYPGPPRTPAPPLFRVRALCKTYGEGPAAVHALAGVDLDLPPGELVVLLGPSGSGKTTLLNNLGGLDVPTSGELWYRDLDLTAANEDQLTRYRRDSVGFIFQFYNLIPSLTARENVGLITEIARDPMPPETALEMVNLGPRLDHFPAQLSGGEQQRVAIARAIAKRPEVLLCDEPTGALDVRTGIVVLEAIERVNRELGTLTVVITHNAVMADMADRVIHFSDGRVHFEHRNAERAAPSTLRW